MYLSRVKHPAATFLLLLLGSAPIPALAEPGRIDGGDNRPDLGAIPPDDDAGEDGGGLDDRNQPDVGPPDTGSRDAVNYPEGGTFPDARVDAGLIDDATTRRDAEDRDAGGELAEAEQGCGCTSGQANQSGRTGAAWIAALVLIPLLRRARR